MIPRSQAKSCKGGWQRFKHGDANAQLINLTSCTVLCSWLRSCTAIALQKFQRRLFLLSTFSLGASSEGIPEEAFSLHRACARVIFAQTHFQSTRQFT